MSELTHFNQAGEAHMVDIADKDQTHRIGIAEGWISMHPETFALVEKGNAKKGDVLAVARIAAIMGSKKTPDLIPLCHPIALTHVNVDFELYPEESKVRCVATCETKGRTGVEMEALTAVQVGLLTIYDMLKAVDRGMCMTDIRLLEKHGGVTAEALVESAFGHIKLLEDCGFEDICVSLKSSSVPVTMAAYKLMSEKSPYPLHIGVTETGTPKMGILKSAVGIGGLLALGIGDTVRVSLSADPVEEVYAARDILKAAGVRRDGPELISCPTCGRTRIDLIGLANEVEERLKRVDKPITVAVMGCVVNGPGEAGAADVGIAGGVGEGLLFQKGQIVKKVPQEYLVEELFRLIEAL